MDNLIKCDRCGSDACFVNEIPTNDGGAIKTHHCMGCGFTTNSLMKEGEAFYNEQKEILPEIYKSLFYTDLEGKIWMPSAVNLPQQGMVFANGTNAENWKWSAVLAVPTTEEDKHKYPIPGKKDQYYAWRMDMETMMHFDERDYMEALSYIGVLPKEDETSLEN
jgi:hypothetical protein